jgi:hypothetical protein
MPILRLALLALALVALTALSVHAQTPTVIAGQSIMAFDHAAGDTVSYELCVDGTGGSDCTPITVAPAPDGTLVERPYTFTAPASLPRGSRVLRVRPVWAGGTATASDAVTFRAVVAPGKPGPVRPGS